MLWWRFYTILIGRATFVVFVFPIIFTRFMMMAGNWGQHAFIDPATPANCYRNNITCVNSPYNKQCFNDGYHIGHHHYPTMHWTDMLVNFMENINSYLKEKAIVFRKLDFSMVWFLLMSKSYGTLAKYYVDLNPNQPKSKSEIIALLKERTRKIETSIAWLLIKNFGRAWFKATFPGSLALAAKRIGFDFRKTVGSHLLIFKKAKIFLRL